MSVLRDRNLRSWTLVRIYETTGRVNMKFWRNIILPVIVTATAKKAPIAAEGACGCNGCIDVCVHVSSPAVWYFCRGFSPVSVAFSKTTSHGINSSQFLYERQQNKDDACRGYNVREYLCWCDQLDHVIVGGQSEPSKN